MINPVRDRCNRCQPIDKSNRSETKLKKKKQAATQQSLSNAFNAETGLLINLIG